MLPYPSRLGCCAHWLLIYTACNSICQIIIHKSSRCVLLTFIPISQLCVTVMSWRPTQAQPGSIGIHSHGSKEDIHHHEFLFSFLFPAGKSRILEQDHVFLPGPRTAGQAAGSPRRVRHQGALCIRPDRVCQRPHSQCAGQVRRAKLCQFCAKLFLWVEPRVACHEALKLCAC